MQTQDTCLVVTRHTSVFILYNMVVVQHVQVVQLTTGTVDVNDDDGDGVCNDAEVTGCTDKYSW